MPDEEVPTRAADDGSVEVEIVSSKEDREHPRLSDEAIAERENVPDDEVAKYAKEAQKRIRGLRVANQEWRRRTMQASEDVATATSLAEQLYRENQDLKSSVNRSETALIDQAVARVESQLAQARTKASLADQAGDSEGRTAAYEEIARAVAERDRLNLVKQQPAPPVTAPSAQPAPPPPRQQPQPESPRLQAWRQQNPWFLQKGEEALTGYALGIHSELESKGVTEQSNPDLYYSTIDARVREKFPERFSRAPARAAPVTGATRVSPPAPGEGPESTDPTKIRLSESEVRTARRLNIPLEEYAKQKVAYAKDLRERQAKVTIQ
jgi:hypothetical protein